MDNQERQVISDIFDRLRHVERETRDPEAERYIADRVRQQPYAPYALAQSLYVQEQALMNLNAEVEALRAEIEQVRRQPQGGGGFLSGLFGGGSRQPEPAPSPWNRNGAPQQGYGGQPGYGGPQGGQPGPWGSAQQGGLQQPPRAGGGFLQGALTTAAGVAGGMMLGSVLTNAFGGHGGDVARSLGDVAGGGDASSMTDSLYSNASFTDPASNDPDASDDFGGDLGAGDDGDWS